VKQLSLLLLMSVLFGCLNADYSAEQTLQNGRPPLKQESKSLPDSGRNSENVAPPPGAESEFSTDFRRHSVPYEQILWAGRRKTEFLQSMNRATGRYPKQTVLYQKMSR
jgi:hypothetical protein